MHAPQRLAILLAAVLAAGPALAQGAPAGQPPGPPPAAPSGSPPGPPSAPPPGGERGPPPQAFADCRGHAAGDKVQHTTPEGVVAATCVETPKGLAARPDRPMGPPPPKDGPPAR